MRLKDALKIHGLGNGKEGVGITGVEISNHTFRVHHDLKGSPKVHVLET
jgi:hypothetical protein